MKNVWLITAGSFLLSVAISQKDIPKTNDVQRVPRALVLQPVIKVNTKDADEGPFDFISDFILNIIKPKKILQAQQAPMLGPFRVPRVNDEVYIKQLQTMPHQNSHVLIKIPPNANYNNMQMSMPLDMNPYGQKTNYPMGSTQVSMQSGGFYPISTPAPNPPWSPSVSPQSYSPINANNIHESPNTIRNGYKNYQNNYRNFRNYPGYPNGFAPNPINQQPIYNHYQHQWQPHQYYSHQYQSGSPQFYPPYDARYRPPPPGHGPYDYHNFIPGNAGGYSNYGMHSPRSTNYSRHLIHQDTDDTSAIEENAAVKEEIDEEDDDVEESNLQENEQVIKEIKYKNIDLPKASPTKSSLSSSELVEIYRADRMASTNPTYKNRFWTRTTLKTTSKVTSTTEPTHRDQVDESSKREQKYSSTGIEEISAPNLKVLKESIKRSNDNKTPDSRMDDEDLITIKDEMTLGKGESREHIDDVGGSIHQLKLVEPSNNVSLLATSRSSRNWKLFDPSKRKKNNFDKGNSTRVENSTPEVLQKVVNLTASNSWRPSDAKKSSTRKLQRLKNSKKRVRVVESVKSSVSMTSSRGVKKPKTKN